LKNTFEKTIDYKVHTSQDSIQIFESTSLDPTQDNLFNEIVNFYQGDEQTEPQDWNLIRKEIINVLVRTFFLPHFIQEIERDFRKNAGKT
jgi:hypothetical protein